MVLLAAGVSRAAGLDKVLGQASRPLAQPAPQTLLLPQAEPLTGLSWHVLGMATLLILGLPVALWIRNRNSAERHHLKASVETVSPCVTIRVSPHGRDPCPVEIQGPPALILFEAARTGCVAVWLWIWLMGGWVKRTPREENPERQMRRYRRQLTDALREVGRRSGLDLPPHQVLERCKETRRLNLIHRFVLAENLPFFFPAVEAVQALIGGQITATPPEGDHIREIVGELLIRDLQFLVLDLVVRNAKENQANDVFRSLLDRGRKACRQDAEALARGLHLLGAALPGMELPAWLGKLLRRPRHPPHWVVDLLADRWAEAQRQAVDDPGKVAFNDRLFVTALAYVVVCVGNADHRLIFELLRDSGLLSELCGIEWYGNAIGRLEGVRNAFGPAERREAARWYTHIALVGLLVEGNFPLPLRPAWPSDLTEALFQHAKRGLLGLWKQGVPGGQQYVEGLAAPQEPD